MVPANRFPKPKPSRVVNGKRTYWMPKDMVEGVYKLALLGATEQQMADFFNVGLTTLKYWKDHHEDFRAAILAGTTAACMNVVSSLYKKAVGYSYKEVTQYKRLDASTGEMIVWKEEVTEKQQAPDAFAALKFLAMKQPEQWSETVKSRIDIHYKGEMDIKMMSEQIKDPKKYTTEELKLALKMGVADILENAKN